MAGTAARRVETASTAATIVERITNSPNLSVYLEEAILIGLAKIDAPPTQSIPRFTMLYGWPKRRT
jgi:hypothetical protein